jgi:CheY-like chemotaxis protein
MYLNGKNVFIVEDNMRNRIIFQVLLSKYGAQVHFERDGHSTLRRLRLAPPVDLILLDLTLNDGISGFDVYDEIHSIQSFDSVPIAAVSAVDPMTGIPQAQGKGFTGFIGKPIDDELFPRQVAKLINREPVWYAMGVDLRESCCP